VYLVYGTRSGDQSRADQSSSPFAVRPLPPPRVTLARLAQGSVKPIAAFTSSHCFVSFRFVSPCYILRSFHRRSPRLDICP
jgi:hypothetical protein